MTPKEINEIADLISEKLMSNKKVLTCEEAARYMGISQSCLYKLTSEKKIPHYKPMGKMVYFERDELEYWLLCNRVAPVCGCKDISVD